MAALFPVKEIALQVPASPDAGFSVWLLTRFGEERFPGINRARFVVWEGGNPPNGMTAQQLEENGILPVNCGGGRFDHHPHNKKPGECAFTLVLEALELKEDPRFLEIKEYILWDDTRTVRSQNGAPTGREKPFTVARFFKDMQTEALELGDNHEKMLVVLEQALEWLFVPLDVYRCKQDRFFTVAAGAFKNASKVLVTGRSGTTYRIVTATTDCNEFGGYARSSYGNKASVVIQKRGDGHIQILTNGAMGVDMAPLAERVRDEEIQYSDLEVDVREDLTVEGAVLGIPHWYYLPAKSRDGASMLLNGSARHRDIPPTKHHLGRLVNLAREWLEEHG